MEEVPHWHVPSRSQCILLRVHVLPRYMHPPVLNLGLRAIMILGLRAIVVVGLRAVVNVGHHALLLQVLETSPCSGGAAEILNKH